MKISVLVVGASLCACQAMVIKTLLMNVFYKIGKMENIEMEFCDL